MTARELINPSLPPLKLSDEAGKALTWMEKFRVRQLPVVDQKGYLGLITEEELLQETDSQRPLSAFDLKHKERTVFGDQHFYDVLRVAVDHKIETVSVLDADNAYIGAITVNESVFAFAQLCAFNGPGGTFVLSMKDRDYSLSEISRLIELNEAKILSSFVMTDDVDPTQIRLTLKINKTDISHVLATLERHGYQVVAKYHEPELGNTDKDRLDMLFKYLDI